jgi:hypothetical protein
MTGVDLSPWFYILGLRVLACDVNVSLIFSNDKLMFSIKPNTKWICEDVNVWCEY